MRGEAHYGGEAQGDGWRKVAPSGGLLRNPQGWQGQGQPGRQLHAGGTERLSPAPGPLADPAGGVSCPLVRREGGPQASTAGPMQQLVTPGSVPAPAQGRPPSGGRVGSTASSIALWRPPQPDAPQKPLEGSETFEEVVDGKVGVAMGHRGLVLRHTQLPRAGLAVQQRRRRVGRARGAVAAAVGYHHRAALG